MGYLGQAVLYVTLDECEATERSYRLEAALHEDETGLWLEAEQTQDADGYGLTRQARLDMPPGHMGALALCFMDMGVTELDA